MFYNTKFKTLQQIEINFDYVQVNKLTIKR